MDSSTYRKETPRGTIATNSASNRTLESSKFRNRLSESSRSGSNRHPESSRSGSNRHPESSRTNRVLESSITGSIRLLDKSQPDDDWSKVETVGRRKRMKAPEVLIHPNRISAETFHRSLLS